MDGVDLKLVVFLVVFFVGLALAITAFLMFSNCLTFLSSTPASLPTWPFRKKISWVWSFFWRFSLSVIVAIISASLLVGVAEPGLTILLIAFFGVFSFMIKIIRTEV